MSTSGNNINTRPPIGFSVDSVDEAVGCPHPFPPPFPPRPVPPRPVPPRPCPPCPPKPIHIDDNVPYNPATYADIERLLLKINVESIERIAGDDSLSGTIVSANARIDELSGVVSRISPSGGGGGSTVIVDDVISNTSTNPVQNRVIAAALDVIRHTEATDVEQIRSDIGQVRVEIVSLEQTHAADVEQIRGELASVEQTHEADIGTIREELTSIGRVHADDIGQIHGELFSLEQTHTADVGLINERIDTFKRTMSDVGIVHITKQLAEKVVFTKWDNIEDARDRNHEPISSSIEFVQPAVNDDGTIMIVPTKNGGLFWSSTEDIVDSSGDVVRRGASYIVRCKLDPNKRRAKDANADTTDAAFNSATFETPVYWNGKFFVTGSIGLFWSADGKTWSQSSGVPTKVDEFCHFHNPDAPKWYCFEYVGAGGLTTCRYTRELPVLGGPTVPMYKNTGAEAVSTTVEMTQNGYLVRDHAYDPAIATLKGGEHWSNKFHDVFMLGNMISFDPSDDDGWIGGMVAPFGEDKFGSPYASVGAFVPVAAGDGTVAGFRGYCHAKSYGTFYSSVAFDGADIRFQWLLCPNQLIKETSIDNMTAGVGQDGKWVVVISPLSVTSGYDRSMIRPVYVKEGGKKLSEANFPDSLVGIGLETPFITRDGSVIEMIGTTDDPTKDDYGRGMAWTNLLDGDNTVWHRSNITKLPWTTPEYVPSIGMYTTAAYRSETKVLISPDAKFWVESGVESNAFPPIDFGGHVVMASRGKDAEGNTTGEMWYIETEDVDETYNLGSGRGGSLEGVAQLSGPYTDKIVKNKVNEIISALGGTIAKIEEPYTDEDVVAKINEIIEAWS